MDKKKKFFCNGLILTLVGIFMRTVAMFFSSFITRKIGAEGIGLYTVIGAVYGFAVTFATSGISLTVTRLVAKDDSEGKGEGVSSVLSGAIVYAFIFGSAASLVLFFGARGFAGGVLGDIRAEVSLRILAPSLLPLALLSVFSGYFIAVRRVAMNALSQIFGQLFKIFISILLISHALPMDARESALTLSLGTTLTELFCFLVVLIEFLFDRRRTKREKGKADVFAVFANAFPLGVSAYIRQALITLEHILIPKRLEAGGKSYKDAIASYGTLHGMALPMILYPMVTLSSFSGLLVPEFAERSANEDMEGMRRLASKAFGMTLVYATSVSVILLTFAEEIGYVVYDSFSAGVYISVLAPLVPIMYLDHVTDSVLKGIGEQVYSMWVNITDALLSVALVYFLLPKMGIMGYAVCIIVMEGYNFILSALRLFKRIKFRISVLDSLVFPGAACALSSLVVKCLFITAGAEESLVWLFLKMLFALATAIGIYQILSLCKYFMLKSKFNAEI